MVMARHRASLMLRNQLLPAIMTLKQHQTLLGKLRTSCMRAPRLGEQDQQLAEAIGVAVGQQLPRQPRLDARQLRLLCRAGKPQVLL